MSGRNGNIGVWNGADGIVVIDDSLAPLAPRVVEAIGRIAEGPIRFVINTHWHPDHTGGNELLGKSGGVVVAHENVRDPVVRGAVHRARQHARATRAGGGAARA